MILLLAVLAISVVAIAGTLRALVTDGYRRIATIR